mgnify:CR=1 FL=1
MDNHINAEYKTRDYAEASVLILKNQKLIQIEREGKTCWFIFENESVCKEISDQYFFGELLLNAREFKEAMDRLKSRIFAKI